jgi:hypothetical protein
MFRIIRIKTLEVQQDVSAVAKAQSRSDLDVVTKRLDERMVSLVSRFRAASGGTEQFVVSRAHGHAANQSGPKTYSKVKMSHACGAVCQRLGPVPGSSVCISALNYLGNTCMNNPDSRIVVWVRAQSGQRGHG